jgi:hypothetical protein
VSRIFLSLMLIGSLLFGQTFCCCTATASALFDSLAAKEASSCCCCSEKGSCPAESERPENCPCKKKRQLADVGVPVTADALSFSHSGLIDLTTYVLLGPAVEIVPLLARRDAHEKTVRALPRADRVALSQLLLC